MRTKIVAFASVVAIAGLLTVGCSSPTTRHGATARNPQPIVAVDGPEFESIERLAERASVVVSGHFVAGSAAVTEGELNGGDWDGLPMELWGFVVDKVLSGENQSLAGTTIRVSQVSQEVDGGTRPAVDGVQAVLFLKPYPSGAYAIVGLGSGVIYVDQNGSLSVPDGASKRLAKEVARLTAAGAEQAIKKAAK